MLNTDYAVKVLKKSGYVCRDTTLKSIGRLRLKLPDNLFSVAVIHPQAFAHYLPVWIKTEVDKRVEGTVQLTNRFSFDVTSEEFVDGPRTTMHIEVDLVKV